MKISSRTSTMLVLRQSPAPASVAAAVLFAAAAGLLLLTRAEPGPLSMQVVRVTLACGLLAGAGFVILRSAPATYTFDLTRRALIITRRRIAGVTSATYDLRNIDDAVVEQAPSNVGSQPTYRLAMHLTNGSRIPLTAYYSRGWAPKAQVATEIRAILTRADGRARGPLDAPAPSASRHRASRQRVTMRTVALAGAFWAVFFAIGARLAWLQYDRLAHWLPTPATVVETHVERHSSTKSTTYLPIVTYRYSVDGQPYVAHTVTPIHETRSGRWAFDLVARWRPGDPAIAYYDPLHPGRAFLLHEQSRLPYIFMLFPVFLVALLWVAAHPELVAALRAMVVSTPADGIVAGGAATGGRRAPRPGTRRA